VSLGPASTRPAEDNCQYSARYLFGCSGGVRWFQLRRPWSEWSQWQWDWARDGQIGSVLENLALIRVEPPKQSTAVDLQSRRDVRMGRRPNASCAMVAGAAGIRLADHQRCFRRMTGRESHPRQALAVQNAAGVMARISAKAFRPLLRSLVAKSDA
jgi:hypothetical protein